MINKVVFFNLCHNGDIHVSRGLVKETAKICEQKRIPCEYYHINDPGLLADIPYVKYSGQNCGLPIDYKSSVRDDVLFINTWYCSDPENYKKYSLSFDTLYYNFKDALKFIDINLDTISVIDLFPNINFEYFYIEKAKQWLSEHNRQRVFFSNGNVLSGQAHNFSFSEIIRQLAKEYDYIDFLVSNKDANYDQPNIYATADIIQKSGFDLNENAYLAGQCSLIVGRCSGAYSFALNSECYWENPKTFLAFTNLDPKEVLWTNKLTPPVKANVIVHNVFDHRVINIIKENLPLRF